LAKKNRERPAHVLVVDRHGTGGGAILQRDAAAMTCEADPRFREGFARPMSHADTGLNPDGGCIGEIVQATLLAARLFDLFDAAVTLEYVRGRGKPAPDLFLKGARRLGVPTNKCLVLGD
jgi:hypothetical protein